MYPMPGISRSRHTLGLLQIRREERRCELAERVVKERLLLVGRHRVQIAKGQPEQPVGAGPRGEAARDGLGCFDGLVLDFGTRLVLRVMPWRGIELLLYAQCLPDIPPIETVSMKTEPLWQKKIMLAYPTSREASR